jgi:putative oligomerization/nucleic acid binding protein
VSYYTSADVLSSFLLTQVEGLLPSTGMLSKHKGGTPFSESILVTHTILKNMRGRWASAALGAGIARHRAGREMEQQQQAYDAQQQEAQRQIEAQQRQIEALQQQKFQQPQQPQPQQEDIQAKLLKYADLHQKGVLTDEEFQRLKADLLSKI